MNPVLTQDDLNRAHARAVARTSLTVANAALDSFTGGHALASIDKSAWPAVVAMLDALA